MSRTGPRASNLPRTIKPELVEIGDLISVTFPEDDGIVMSKRGRVAYREDHGAVRFMKTAEGGTLFTWDEFGSSLSIILLERGEVEQMALPGL